MTDDVELQELQKRLDEAERAYGSESPLARTLRSLAERMGKTSQEEDVSKILERGWQSVGLERE
jgi:hypothetical protein